MLSLLPDLLDFSAIAPILLRVALGGTFLGYGLCELIKPKYLLRLPTDESVGWARIIGAWEFLIGALLIAGLFTQIAALLAGLELLGYLFLRLKGNLPVGRQEAKMLIPIDYLLVMLSISISLILLGPGLFAFDLPL